MEWGQARWKKGKERKMKLVCNPRFHQQLRLCSADYCLSSWSTKKLPHVMHPSWCFQFHHQTSLLFEICKSLLVFPLPYFFHCSFHVFFAPPKYTIFVLFYITFLFIWFHQFAALLIPILGIYFPSICSCFFQVLPYTTSTYCLLLICFFFNFFISCIIRLLDYGNFDFINWGKLGWSIFLW